MHQINLWEALTTLERRNARDECISPRVTEDDIRELSHSTRWNGQELSVGAVEEGWLIKVFSCYSEDVVTGIEILIPKDGPVRVLKDRNGIIEYHHPKY